VEGNNKIILQGLHCLLESDYTESAPLTEHDEDVVRRYNVCEEVFYGDNCKTEWEVHELLESSAERGSVLVHAAGCHRL
jgi:hypothetical protein